MNISKKRATIIFECPQDSQEFSELLYLLATWNHRLILNCPKKRSPKENTVAHGVCFAGRKNCNVWIAMLSSILLPLSHAGANVIVVRKFGIWRNPKQLQY